MTDDVTCLICGHTIVGWLVIGMGETKHELPVCSIHATDKQARRRLHRLLEQGGRDAPLRSNR